MKQKPPLALFVIWHPDFKDGRAYADHIFCDFKRDVASPLNRGMNIPVFYRYTTPLLPIPFDDYELTVTIALVDQELVLDDAFRNFVAQASRQAAALLIPVAIDKSAFSVGLGHTNMARLYERTNKKAYLTTIIAHEVLRHMYNLTEPVDKTSLAPPPLKIFVSHAKADGLVLARQLKSYIETELPLKTFFDANDIAIGYDFAVEIEQYIEKAVVVALHTDVYSSREWCRREILLAKQHNRPIVVLNCFHNGEMRSFPYMANVLTVHFPPNDADNADDDVKWERLMTAVLKETLRLKYSEDWIAYQAKRRGKQVNPGSVFGYPPELVTVLNKKKDLNGTVIYPEPPLGAEELDVLKKLDDTIQYLTPADL